MNNYSDLLSEQFRPKDLDDIFLPRRILNSLKRMLESGNVMNLLFYGTPGIGKTSAARILCKQADVYEINGSHNNGDKTMTNDITRFATAASLSGENKIVFIDEADFMPKSVQESLRYIIEAVSRNTRFILTANNISGITPAIKSRCVSIPFDVTPNDRSEVIETIFNRYKMRLEQLGTEFDPVRLKEIIGIYFPDLREIANRIQLEFGF